MGPSIADEDTGEVLVELGLPDEVSAEPGQTGPGSSGLAVLERDDDGCPWVVQGFGVNDFLPSITVSGMIDGVIDAAQEWSTS